MGIKNKNRAPKAYEFNTKEVVVDVKGGALFYKSNTDLYKVEGDNVSSPDVKNSYKHTQLYPFHFYEADAAAYHHFFPWTGGASVAANAHRMEYGLACAYDGYIDRIQFAWEGSGLTAYRDEHWGPDWQTEAKFSLEFKIYQNQPVVPNRGNDRVFNEYAYGGSSLYWHQVSDMILIGTYNVTNIYSRQLIDFIPTPTVFFKKGEMYFCSVNVTDQYTSVNAGYNIIGNTIIKYKI